ncbi:MAG: rod shape-determining protein RodA [bacterium]
MKNVLTYARSLDWVLVGIVLILLAYGLVILYSLTLNVSSQNVAAFWNQLWYVGIGIVVFFLASFLDYRYLRSYAWVLFGVGILLLIALRIFGTEIRGIRSWFVLGGVTFQPVEIIKIILVIFLVRYFTDHGNELYRIRHLLVSGAATGIFLLLIILQPDLGSALILLGTFLALVLLVNIRRSHLLVLFVLLAIVAVVSWLFLLQGYQRDRILTVLDPSRDPLGRGYNAKQALVAIGSGRFFGRGLGLGSQSQLNFLPEQKTDFIFAVIAEELGLVGASALLGLYAWLLFRIYRIASQCSNDFGAYLVFGIGLVIFIQMLMNVGMNLGLLPVAGVPLPFVSAGGSSLIAMLFAMGVVQSVALRSRQFSFQQR